MNIIGSLGVLLTGDSSSLIQATRAGEQALGGLRDQVSSVSKTLPLLRGAINTAIGVTFVGAITTAVRAWLPLEEKIAGLGQLIDDSGVVEKMKEIAKSMSDFAGIDETRTFRMAESIKMMGVENKDLAKTLSLVQGIQIASNGMVGERQGLRMLQMYQSGNTKMFERYVSDLGKATTAEQKQALIQDWLTNGLKRKGAEMNSTAGQIKRYHSAQTGLVESMGEMFTRVLQLDRVYGLLATRMRQARDWFDGLSVSTKGWIAAAIILIGVVFPLVTVISLLLPVLKAVGLAVLSVGGSFLKVLLPAVVAVSAAFLGWNLGKTLNNLQVGGKTIGQYMKELSMSILKGWDWLWDIMPQKVAIAFTKIRLKIAEFRGKDTSMLLSQLKLQENVLKEKEGLRESRWEMNEDWLKKQQKESEKTAITSWKQFADSFSKNAGDSLGKLLETLKEVGEKIGSGDLMKSLLSIITPKEGVSPKMPEMPEIPQIGEGKAKGEAPQYAAALERGTAGAYSVQVQQVERLSKIQSASEDTADNTETTNTLLEELLNTRAMPAFL